jgi:ketosteroid isomerase-like protein
MNRGIMRAMSEENLATVRRSYEAFARGDLDATVADADPELVTFRGYPDAATFHGPQGFMQAVAEWVENFDDFSLKPEEFIDANNEHVVVRVHQSAVGAQSGVPVEEDFWFVHTLKAGKLTRLDMLVRKEEALRAAGLSE